MSLDVSPQLLADAEKGEVREEEFVRTVRTSLPYAYALIASLVGELRAGKAEFTDNQTPPLPAGARGDATWARFTSPRSQILNRSAEFRDC